MAYKDIKQRIINISKSALKLKTLIIYIFGETDLFKLAIKQLDWDDYCPDVNCVQGGTMKKPAFTGGPL